MIQAHVFFSGTVQGVGFRYTALRLACILQLTGWVKNLSDGRVEMIVEGPPEKIEELLKKIDQRLDGYIQDKQINRQPAGEEFKDFQIR